MSLHQQMQLALGKLQVMCSLAVQFVRFDISQRNSREHLHPIETCLGQLQSGFEMFGPIGHGFLQKADRLRVSAVPEMIQGLCEVW